MALVSSNLLNVKVYLYSLYLCGHDTKFVKKMNIFAKKTTLSLIYLN